VPFQGDREELKESVVRQFTGGRTDSLREMTAKEYDDCLSHLERLSGYRERLRKERSRCLSLMQRMGVDTTSWQRINALCEDARIAGKPFARLTVEELLQLCRKLRAIQNKGGFSAPTDEKKEDGRCLVVMMPDKSMN